MMSREREGMGILSLIFLVSFPLRISHGAVAYDFLLYMLSLFVRFVPKVPYPDRPAALKFRLLNFSGLIFLKSSCLQAARLLSRPKSNSAEKFEEDE
jgi:hypothetical protein